MEEEGAVHSDEAFEAQPFPPESFSKHTGIMMGMLVLMTMINIIDHDDRTTMMTISMT